jgi:hypothetical protein
MKRRAEFDFIDHGRDEVGIGFHKLKLIDQRLNSPRRDRLRSRIGANDESV